MTQVPVNFSITQTVVPDKESIDYDSYHELMDNLLSRGIDTIEINWMGWFSDVLFVEDDASFLAEAFSELNTFTEEGDEHHIFLGDGSLQITAILNESDTVKMHVVYTPHLDRIFTKSKEAVIDLSSYLAGWHDLMRQLNAVVE